MQKSLDEFGGEASVDPAINETHTAYEEKIVEYLKEWYPTVHGKETAEGLEPDFYVDWSSVTIKVSGRMTSSLGLASANKDRTEFELKVSKHLIENRTWERVYETVRHETIHLWQYQHDSIEASHGFSFTSLMNEEQFDCSVHAEEAAKEHKYEIYCTNCGELAAKRQRKCKLTKQTHRYNCSLCGGDLTVETNE